MLPVDAVKTTRLIGATEVLKESTLTIKLEGKVMMAETATDLSTVLPAWWPYIMCMA